MKDRVLIKDLGVHIGEAVTVCGSVEVRRDQGKLVFFDLRDRSGQVQGVVPSASSALATAKEVRPQSTLKLEALVKARPEKNTQAQKQNGNIELEIKNIEILSAAEALPFDLDADLNLDTLLDYRPLTLRRERERDIFAVQATIVDAYRRALSSRGFTEFQAPALVGADAEGGAAVFKVEYFNDRSAYLATSPQLYKQIMVGAFERAFTIARIFRAEKSATTRHVSELTQMDFEMGYVEDEREVMATLEAVIREVMGEVASRHAPVFPRFGIEAPKLGEKFPILTLAEALQMLGARAADDLEPEHERQICEWALKEHGSDFVFIIRFPSKARAFYTMDAGAGEPGLSRGFDLLMRGLEINSGAQRIHSYQEMLARIEARGMKPENFRFYLQAFKYGMPPHGGCSTGLERFTARTLGLANVKEATAFPRDMHRIDILLSQNESDELTD